MFEGSAGEIRNVVLVHGGFVDGSGWEGVHRSLRRQGFNVSVVQNPTMSLADDVRATRWVLDGLDGPAILVGHSYGGVVISEADNAPNVAGLVYIAAFAPDAGESVATLIKDPAPGAPVPPILPPREGFLLLDRSKFAAPFAADVEPDLAAFMADAQVPWGVPALEGAVSRAGLEDPAELVSGDHRRSHDPACCSARDGRARRRHRRRGGGKPLGVCLAARGGGSCHRHGSRGSAPCGCVNGNRRRESRSLGGGSPLPRKRLSPRHTAGPTLRRSPPASRHRRSVAAGHCSTVTPRPRDYTAERHRSP